MVECQTKIFGLSRSDCRGGFSLVELLAVLVVGAVLAGVALPALGNLVSTRVGAAQMVLARDLTYARDRALATGTLHRVTFDTTNHRYSLVTVAGTNPAGTSTTPVAIPGSGAPFIRQLNSGEFAGVRLTQATFGSGTTVTFDWSGRPFDAAGSALTAAGSAWLNAARRVDVLPVTGVSVRVDGE